MRWWADDRLFPHQTSLPARLTLVEAAVDTLTSALSAHRAGAGRIELCANLIDGGTTPSAGLITAAGKGAGVPVFALVRPRGGDFVYSREEMDVMRHDIDVALTSGINGFATGVLKPDHTIDTVRTRELVSAASGLPVTFHRAFDLAPDLPRALDELTDCGVRRVLTSGGAPTALEGADAIARLVELAEGRITVIAGGGIREHNVREIIDRTGVVEIHARMTSLAMMRALVDSAASRSTSM